LYKGRFFADLRSLSGRPCYQGDVDHNEALVKGYIGKYPVESFQLEIDGQSLHGDWEWIKAYEIDEEGRTHAVVELKNKIVPVTIAVHSRLDGTAFVERWLDITNDSGKPMNLSKVCPMSGMLWGIASKREHALPVQFRAGVMPMEVYYDEGAIQWRDIQKGTTAFENRNGRSGWGVPWFCVENCVSGEVFVGHLEWSGNWRIEFEMIDYYNSGEMSLMFSAGPASRAPMRVIAAGETISSPVMHLGHIHGAVQNWVQETHRHVRNVSLEVTEKNLYIGAGRMVDGDLDWLEEEVKLSANMGMEYFLLDAGWFNDKYSWVTSCGDWKVKRFGGSFDKVREMFKKYNLIFGLWLEPESFGKDSEIYKQKPDWAIHRDGENIEAGYSRWVFDLSKPEVFDYVEKSIMDLFDVHKVEYYKIDLNSTYIYEHGENMKAGVKENAMYRYVQALYAIYDKINSNYPEVFIENCAGGGGRNDLGFFKRCHANTLSDFAVFPRSIKALNNITMALPPERIRFYYRHFKGYHMYGDLDTQMRMLMFCVPIFVGFGRDESWVNEAENAVVGKYIILFKNYCRKILPDCKVYHHTPSLKFFDHTEPWCVMEYAGERAGYAGLFRLITGADKYVFIPRGINIGKNYLVTFMNSGNSAVISGVTLATVGLPVSFDGALTSEMILYEEHNIL